MWRERQNRIVGATMITVLIGAFIIGFLVGIKEAYQYGRAMEADRWRPVQRELMDHIQDLQKGRSKKDIVETIIDCRG